MDLSVINEQEKKWLLKEKYEGVETDEFFRECALIDEGMPVAYLIGNVEFLSCHIDLSSRPLIPRAETEYRVNELIKEYKEKSSEIELRNLKVLDIFAGSGCIGIAIAKHFGCHVDFAELKPQHCEQIKKNLGINFSDDEQERFNIYQSDVFGSVPEKEYDFIVANPPYVAKGNEKQVQDSVKKYEDPDAVFAEDNGNALIKELVNQSKDYVSDTGELWFEFDPSQSSNLRHFLFGIGELEVIKDQFNQKRFFRIKNVCPTAHRKVVSS